MTEQQLNWAGNLTYQAATLHRPQTVAQVQALVAASRRVKALGSRHSFNAIADTPGDLISLEHLGEIVALDPERRTVTVEAGVRYGNLAPALYQAGFALPNLASLPHISVAGACATATHGSGDKNRCLATSVAALELVTADGSLLTLSPERDGERFRAAVVGLGALGVVTRVTLNLVPAFEVRQEVYLGLPFERLAAEFDAITGSAYSVSLFTDWAGDRVEQVWVKRRFERGETSGVVQDFFGARPASVKVHPIMRLPAEPCTEQLGLPGPWHTRLPHFRMEYVPSSGAELQSEYFVARRHAVDALDAIRGLRAEIAPVLQISEVRTIAADDLLLSPFAGRESVAFHFTWLPDWSAVAPILARLEERLAPFDARPHWGKLFTTPPARLRALYPQLPAFAALQRELDPTGKFRNDFLDHCLSAG